MKSITRRDFLKGTAIAGAGLALPLKLGVGHGHAFAQSPLRIRKFVTHLPGLGAAGANEIGQYIPVATPTQVTFQGLVTDVYNLTVKQYAEKMHPDLNATRLWGYSDDGTSGIGKGDK